MSFVERMRNGGPRRIAWCFLGDAPDIPQNHFGLCNNTIFSEPIGSGAEALVRDGVARRQHRIMPYMKDGDPIGIDDADRMLAFMKVAHRKRSHELAQGWEFDACVLSDGTIGRAIMPDDNVVYTIEIGGDYNTWNISTAYLVANSRTFDRLALFFRYMPMFKDAHIQRLSTAEQAMFIYTRTIDMGVVAL